MTLEEKKLRQHLLTLLNVVAEQQAESLASQHHEARAPNKKRSVHRGSSCPSGQPGHTESVHSSAACKVNSGHGPRGSSSVHGRIMTQGGSDG
jgi:hypothetical protein